MLESKPAKVLLLELQRQEDQTTLEEDLKVAIRERSRQKLHTSVNRANAFLAEGEVPTLVSLTSKAGLILGRLDEEEQERAQLNKANEEAMAEDASPLKKLRAKLEQVHYEIYCDKVKLQDDRELAQEHPSLREQAQRRRAETNLMAVMPRSTEPAPPPAAPISEALYDNHRANASASIYEGQEAILTDYEQQVVYYDAARSKHARERERAMREPRVRETWGQSAKPIPTHQAVAYSPLEAMRFKLDQLQFEQKSEGHARMGHTPTLNTWTRRY